MSRVSVRWSFNLANWDCCTKCEWVKALQCLQIEERERIRQFKYLRDAKASIVGRLMLRNFAKRYLFDSNKEIWFSRSKKGKPILMNIPGTNDTLIRPLVALNVSHHVNLVVFAAEILTLNENSSEPESHSKHNSLWVGVDVMKLTEKPGFPKDFFRLMQSKFTSSEWDFILQPKRNETEEAKLARFYRLWSLKESFIKAEGSGLNWDLQRLEFKICEDLISTEQPITSTKMLLDDEVRDELIYEETLLDEEYCVSVAVKMDFSDKSMQSINSFFSFANIKDLLDPLKPLAQDLDEHLEWKLQQQMEIEKL